MKVKSLQNAQRGAFCNTFDLYYATICHQNLILYLFLSGPFTQVFLYPKDGFSGGVVQYVSNND